MMGDGPRRRGSGSILVPLLFIALVAVFGASFLAAAFDPTIVTSVRGVGGRRILPFEQGRWISGAIGGGLLLWAATLAARAARGYRRLPKAVAETGPDGLRLGEAVRWSGRPGLRALGVGHLFNAIAVLLLAVPLILALRFIWAGPAAQAQGLFGLLWKLGATLVATLALGGMAVVPLHHVLLRDNRWLHHLTGRLLVTDRRLLWCNAFGKVAHAIDGTAIEDVVHVRAGRRNREEIHLRVRTSEGTSEDLVLVGLPDAPAAAAALARVARLTRP